MLKKSYRPWLLAVGVVPLALTLTGCFGVPGLPNLGGSGGDGDSTTEDEIVEGIVEGSQDGVDYEAGALPADFPVDAVPLVDGDIDAAVSISDGQAWTVTMTVADQATAESADDLLQSAGFSDETGFWETDEYLVLVVTQQDDEGDWVVYYQVQVQK